MTCYKEFTIRFDQEEWRELAHLAAAFRNSFEETILFLISSGADNLFDWSLEHAGEAEPYIRGVKLDIQTIPYYGDVSSKSK